MQAHLSSQSAQNTEPFTKCLLGSFPRIAITPDPTQDDANNPHERFLKISNGLPEADEAYEGAILRIRLNHTHLQHKLIEATLGNTFDFPDKYRKPQIGPSAWVVRDLKNGLAWVEVNSFGVSPISGFDQIPTLVQTVAETARYFGHHLEWQDDRDSD